MILDAALKVMAEQGYENAGVAQILAEANVSTRSFYRHFESKDDLIRALFLSNAQGVKERLDAKLAAAATPRDGVQVWIEELLSLAYDRRRAARAALITSPGARTAPGFENVVAESLHLLVAPLERVLEAGVADGTLPKADPARDAQTIHAMVWGVIEWYRIRRTPSRRDAVANCVRFALAPMGAEMPDTTTSARDS